MPPRSAKDKNDSPPEGHISVERLHLDRENPRLPEHLLKNPEGKILEYFYEEGTLLELAESFLDNGYFAEEPLIVHRRTDGDYDVFEGNRRLATLLILFQRPVAKDLRLDVTPTKQQLSRLRFLPVREVASRDEVRPYVGFRHIGGMKKWAAEAKARYVYTEIEALAKLGDSAPFKTLARRVGSIARAMRASYAAIALIRKARDEEGFDYQSLIDERRFGVWLRAYDAPKIRAYINFGDPTEYADVKKALRDVDTRRLAEVLNDFVSNDGNPPVMDDSRDMTLYAAVLADAKARKILRKTKNLEAAAYLVADETLISNLNKLIHRMEALQDKALQTKMDEHAQSAADELVRAARALHAVIHRSGDDE